MPVLPIDLPTEISPDYLKRRLELFETLSAAYTERAGQYKSCIIEGMLRKNGRSWVAHPLFVKFWFEPTGRPAESHEYPSGTRLVRAEISSEEGWALVTKHVRDTTWEVPGIGPVYVGDQSAYLEEHNSGVSMPGIGWRCVHTSFSINGQLLGARYSSLVSPDAPLFPDSDKATMYWTGIDANWGSGHEPKLTLILPEFSCRVSGLALGQTETDVVVEAGPCPPETIFGQFFAMAEDHRMITGRFEGPVGAHSVKVGFVPELFDVNIYDGPTKRLLDGRSYHRGNVYGTQGVSWKQKSEDLRAVIMGGESEYLEFKQEWNAEALRFKEGVTAFANSLSGGAIIFGVKNSPIEIAGVKETWDLDKWKLTLGNAVRDTISPVPEISVSEEFVPERLIVVEVASGNRPPYLLRNRGVLIRAGSNNRVPEQYELVELVKRGLPDAPGSNPP